MEHRRIPLVALVALLGGCGGAEAPAPEAATAAATAAPAGPAMTGAVLTTAVDAKGESAAPASTRFARDTERIFLLAQLSGLAPDSKVEVVWSVIGGETLHRSVDTLSGDQRLSAVLPAPPEGFDGGDCRVSVLVDGAPVGQVDFQLGGRTQEWTGVRGLLVCAAVTAWTGEAIEPTTSFPEGTQRVYATFQVRTNDQRPFVRVAWLQGERELAAGDLECGREVRCVDAYEKGNRLPPGDYEVEVTVNGEVMARRGFHVGGDPVSPMLLHAALGVAKGKKKQLPSRHADVFESRTSGLRCGVRLSTLPDEATIRVAWIAVTDGGDRERHVSEEVVTGGGTRTAVLDWPVDGTLEPGRYKAVVTLGSRTLRELAFTVK